MAFIHSKLFIIEVEVTTCAADRMTLNLNPYGQVAKVCIAGKSSQDACCFTSGANPASAPRAGLSFDVMYTDTTCGNVDTFTDANVRMNKYENPPTCVLVCFGV